MQLELRNSPILLELSRSPTNANNNPNEEDIMIISSSPKNND